MAISVLWLWPGLYASWRGNRTLYLLVWEGLSSGEPEVLSVVRTLPSFLSYGLLQLPLTSWVTLGQLLHFPGLSFPICNIKTLD